MRMKHHPEGANLLYEALDNDDLELAHKIAVKYDFNIREDRRKRYKTRYVYYSRFYDGNIKQYKTDRELSKALGMRLVSIRARLTQNSGNYWVKGPMTGYVIWRERAGLSDQPLNIPKPIQPIVATERKKYTYFLQQVDGKVSEYQSINDLGEALGRDRGTLYQYFRSSKHTWNRGELKGMSVWRVEC